MDNLKFSVWWVPQVPMNDFRVDAASLQEARKICDVLAAYDLFQFENGVKPDYCNAGGIQFQHPITEGEWWDVPDEVDEWDDLMHDMYAHNEKLRKPLTRATSEDRANG